MSVIPGFFFSYFFSSLNPDLNFTLVMEKHCRDQRDSSNPEKNPVSLAWKQEKMTLWSEECGGNVCLFFSVFSYFCLRAVPFGKIVGHVGR